MKTLTLAVILVLVAAARSAAVQTLYLSDEQKSISWNYGNGEQSTLTLSCDVHGFSLNLESPAGTDSQLAITSPAGTCSSNLKCDDIRPDDWGLSVVNFGDYQDEMSYGRAAPAECKSGRVDWSYETCMNDPVKDGSRITYTATALVKQSHALAAIAPCKLDHQTVVQISCCVTPPDVDIVLERPPPLHYELRACEKAEFSILPEPLQSAQSDHISWVVYSPNIDWESHDHVGWFIHSCTGTIANGDSIQLFHHSTSNVLNGRTQNCAFPDVTVARVGASSKPNYSYVFDSPFVLPPNTDPEKYNELTINCRVRFCNKGSDKLFAADCPEEYPPAISTSLTAKEPNCPVTVKNTGKMLPGKVSVDHSF